jgi:DeoR family transcriptional regulator of aga operon
MPTHERQPADGPLIDQIGEARPALTKTFQRIADVLLADPARFTISSVQELAAAAEASEPSIVRFCRHFGYNGAPEFRIALAMSLAREHKDSERLFVEPSVADKAIVNKAKKQAIARAAIRLLEQDRSIILDSGSTIELFARNLRAEPARTVLTAGLNIVETLWGCRQHTIIMPGGIVRFDARALSGRMVEQALTSMRFDTVYFGADSIDPVEGLSTFNEDEAHQNTAMANASKRVVVLVDSSKFRAPGLHRFCAIDRIDTIVTDASVSDEIVEAVRQRGVNVIIAPLLPEES